MSDDIREELEGFVEAWRDDAAQSRDSADLPGPTVAETYDECADELEAFLKRQADAYLAAAGPADDGERHKRAIDLCIAGGFLSRAKFEEALAFIKSLEAG